MTILTVRNDYPTHTEVKELKLFFNWKWWRGTTYFTFRLFTNYILKN